MATQFVFANNVLTSLASAITSTTQTTITLASTANLPTIAGGQTFAITLTDAATNSVFEVMYATARTGAVLTVSRGQEGTTATTWLVGDIVYASDTAGILGNFGQVTVAGAQAIDTSATAQTKMGGFVSNGYLAAGAGGSSAIGDITAGRSATTGLYAFGSAAQYTLDCNISNANTFTFNSNVKAPNLIDTNTANQVITAPKVIESVFSFEGSGSRLLGIGIPTNGFQLSPASDTQAGTFVIVNNAETNNLLIFSHLSSTEGRLLVAGQIAAGPGGLYFDPGAAAGDLVAQRSNAGGVLFLGGTGSSGSLDWNVNTSLQFSLRQSGVGFAPVTGGTYTTISDASTKVNVVPIADATASVLALKPVAFDRLHDDGSVGAPGLGFVAQDVEMVLPSLVVTASDHKKGVAYHGFAAVLTAAFQELHAEFTAYKAAHP